MKKDCADEDVDCYFVSALDLMPTTARTPTNAASEEAEEEWCPSRYVWRDLEF